MPNSTSFTIASNAGLLRMLQTPCRVCEAFDPATAVPPLPEFKPFTAIWDTGATSTVITQKVVGDCGLKPIGMTQVHGVNSTDLSEVYLVNAFLLNNVGIQQLRVTKGKLHSGIDVLIGMDIITLGDFCVTNKDGRTVFSFRCPSCVSTDYVKEHNAKVAFEQRVQHAGGSGFVGHPRRSRHKNKRR